jgi:diguanylate cyclase (GGDEF)-like protein
VEGAETLEFVKTLLELSSKGAPISEIQTIGVEMITTVTSSEGGYFHAFDEQEIAINLCVWSKRVVETCDANATSHYPLEAAGIWADCVRQRSPVIHNDYQGIPDSAKGGLPENHFPVRRHMSVPVFSQNKIVAIAGVGNKAEPYDETDTRNAQIIAEVMWAITEQRMAQQVLKKYAFEDALTSIGNRRQFNATLEDEWNRHRRSQTPLGLIMYDIDFFKKLNDSLGHDQGDICLQKIATILRGAFRRSGEVVCRYGGEEFMVILPSSDLETTLMQADAGRQKVEEARIPHPDSPIGNHVTVSGGAVSVIPGDGTFERVEKLVDQKLYEAKQAGRNRVC